MSGAGSGSRAVRLPIRARLLAMSERTRALLEYHFDHDGRRVFTIASGIDEADVVIADYDYPGARADIENGRWRGEAPLMVLAHGAPTLAEAAVVLRKPLDRARLDAAALSLLTIDSAPVREPRAAVDDEADAHGEDGAEAGSAIGSGDGSESEIGAGDEDVDGATGEERRQVRAEEVGGSARRGGRSPRAEAILAARARADAARGRRRAARVAMLCGTPRSASDFAAPDDDAHRHDPGRYPLAHLERARAACEPATKGLSLAFDGIEVYVLPWLHRILTTASLERRDNVERLFRPFDDEEVEVTGHTLATVNVLIDRVNRRARHAFSPESFTWLAALFAARGRLPFGVDVERPYRLRHWPNLTRIERIPDGIRIAAAWSAEPRSIASMFAVTGTEPRFVTAFHVGAAASGLFDANDLDDGSPRADEGSSP